MEAHDMSGILEELARKLTNMECFPCDSDNDTSVDCGKQYSAILSALKSAKTTAAEDMREECAYFAENSSFEFDIDIWMNSTKKEMTALMATAIAAGQRSIPIDNLLEVPKNT